MTRKRRQPRRWPWIVLLLVILAGGSYAYYASTRDTTTAESEPALQTTTVRRGDIRITAVGDGALQPAEEVALGFKSGGVLVDLPVQVGDTVEAGQVLARLDDGDAQRQLRQAQIALELAELKLADVQREPSAAERAAAEENLRAAELALYRLAAGPTATTQAMAEADLGKARAALNKAQSAYDTVAWRPEISSLPQSLALEQATLEYQKALANYENQTAGASADTLAAARAKVATATEQLEKLAAGPSAEAVRTAELQVEQAQLALQQAETALAATTLRAPIAGAITGISAAVGETVNAGTLLTLANLEQALVRFYLEESDLAKAVPGNPTRVTFDAYPDIVFEGVLTRVDPALVTVQNVPAVQAWTTLTRTAGAPPLLMGLSAEVELVAGEATRTLLVPVQALRELSPGQFAVFVVQADGSLRMTPVEVGLRDFANAEILSGLQSGDVVSTGTVETP